MSDTPRTDAAVFLTIGAGYNSVDPNFARELERENAALNHKLDEILTNKDYDGGVRFWINKHDAVLLREASLCAENAALRSRCEELESERTQFANRAARLAAVEHELEESRKAERLARVQLQAEREARK